jgi:hypothetical protein
MPCTCTYITERGSNKAIYMHSINAKTTVNADMTHRHQLDVCCHMNCWSHSTLGPLHAACGVFVSVVDPKTRSVKVVVTVQIHHSCLQVALA